MKTIFLQFWEESERGWGVRPDGASLHIDIKSHKNYINNIYSIRKYDDVPNEYERVVGSPIEVKVAESLYEIVSISKDVRLPQYQLNNLIKLKDIIVDE